MGDRTTSYYPCPKCGKQMEEYDAPSCLQFFASCSCGFTDERDYFEIGEHEITLCTPEELETLKATNPEVKKFRDELDAFWDKWEKENNEVNLPK